jgi:hypothetical protein
VKPLHKNAAANFFIDKKLASLFTNCLGFMDCH